MSNLAYTMGMVLDLLLVIFGFGLIIFLHELGHFLAARWAGIRVLAFAVGFGTAALSWRKGLGLRRGSSERAYLDLLAREGGDEHGVTASGVCPTEYRLNWFPMGGYVKMLGQEDANPTAVSDAPDSYQSCVPWKKMIVISAGVTANVITAALLFMVVFLVGLRTEPPTIGLAMVGSPAAEAVASNAAEAGVTDPGLKPGDELVSINGREPNSFNDLVLAVAMAKRGEPVEVVAVRPGVDTPLHFSIMPQTSPISGLLEIGAQPYRTARIMDPRPPSQREAVAQALDQLGLAGVEPGMRLVRIEGFGQVASAADLDKAVRASQGRPLKLIFADDTDAEVAATIEPQPELDLDFVAMPGGSKTTLTHLLGLTPVLRVADVSDRGRDQGLEPGDVIVRAGTVEYPSVPEGIAQIRAHKGSTIELEVLRTGPDGSIQTLTLNASVSRAGQIGFSAGDTAMHSTLLALPPKAVIPIRADAQPQPVPAGGIITRPGVEILRVGQTKVATLAQLRTALRDATRAAHEAGDATATVDLTLRLPLPQQDDGTVPTQTVAWTLDRAALDDLFALSWLSPIGPGLFELEEFTLKADGPIDAVGVGLSETNRVMRMTYLTFARLFEGTVKVEHLKGPVGIAHLGTRIAQRGLIWLLFFAALISVNLAVINFLPLPIVDGGQFLMIVYEQIRGRPVPVGFQNVVTLAGLVLIGVMFLIVTYNDIVGLFGG